MPGLELNFPVQPIIDPTLAAVPPDACHRYSFVNDILAADAARYPHLQAEHIANSHRAMADTADEALRRAPSGTPRRALLLAVGNGYDIPVEPLVDTFDTVTLVDADPYATERTLSSLSARQLGKVSLVGADVSGIVGTFLTDMHRISEAHASYADFVAEALPAAGSLEVRGAQPDLGGDYTFVGSHLAMSQLAGYPIAEVHSRIMQGKYTHEYRKPQLGTQEATFVAILGNLNRLVQIQHIVYLRRLIAASGAVHFADTMTLLDDGMGRGQRELVDHEFVSGAVDKYFAALREAETWVWHQRPGRRYVVMSQALTPRTGKEG